MSVPWVPPTASYANPATRIDSPNIAELIAIESRACSRRPSTTITAAAATNAAGIGPKRIAIAMWAVAEKESRSAPGFSDWRTISASAAIASPINGAITENAGRGA